MELYVMRERDNKGVYIKVILDGFEPLLFYRASPTPLEVQLLQEKLVDALGSQCEHIRSVSYKRGWRDAKHKKPKQDWFATCLQVLDWETRGIKEA